MTLPLVDAPTRNTCACSSAGSQALRREPAVAACCSDERVAPAVHLRKGMTSHELPHPETDEASYRRRLRWGLGVFLAIAVFFLWKEHRAHLFGVLPWLLLLACPLMHMLMRRRHNGQHGGAGGSPDKPGEGHQEHEHGGHGSC
jgi:hypothetical protein